MEGISHKGGKKRGTKSSGNNQDNAIIGGQTMPDVETICQESDPTEIEMHYETKDYPEKIVTKTIPSNIKPTPAIADLSGKFSNLGKKELTVSDEFDTNRFSEQKLVSNPASGTPDTQNILKESHTKWQLSKKELEIIEMRLLTSEIREISLEKKLDECSKENELIKENEMKQNFIIMEKEKELEQIQAENEEIQLALLNENENMARELEKMKAMLEEKEEKEIRREKEKEELLKQIERELIKQKELQIPCFEDKDEVNRARVLSFFLVIMI